MFAMLVIGVLAGLAAATGQAFSYQLGRRASLQNVAPLRLMVSVQLLFLLIGAAWLSFRGWPLQWPWGLLLLAVTGFVCAQLGTFVALRYIPGSRLAPLMGLKVALLAVAGWLLGMEAMNGGRWLAVLLILAAFAAVWRSGALPWQGLVAALWTMCCFALADICVTLVIRELPERGLVQMADFLAVQYMLGGLLVSPLLCWKSCRPRWDERGSVVPYALCWLAAVLMLMYGFALAGLLLTVFCQALRGPLSVVLGWVLSRMGMTGLEKPQSGSAWVRQLAAALLMVAAIVVDLWFRPQ